MDHNNEANFVVSATRLGIRGLPSLTDGMVSGGVYVLIAETPPARFSILAGSLASALGDGIPCTVIVAAEPGAFLRRIEPFEHIDVAGLIARQHLNVFTIQDEFSKKMFRYGASTFVRELEQFEIAPDSYLVFDQADELLSLHDITLALDQIEVLQKWAEQRRVTMLLVFSRANEAHIGTLNALMDNLGGLARLGSDREGLELTFDYWQSPDGTIAARNYRLVAQESGLYEASTKSLQMDAVAAESGMLQQPQMDDEQAHYFYMDPDLAVLTNQLPGIWRRVDTLVGMLHATRDMRSPTCILTFARDTELRQLAEAVHTLRYSLGRRARIVVQEKEASLRYQNEALLLRLGLNLVINRDVPTSRLPLLLASLSGQIFERSFDVNFEATLSSVLPTRLSGYLAPARFSSEADSILLQAQTLSIPCALIVGQPVGHVAMQDLLVNNGLSRPGDLISASSQQCYIFLNACPQSVLLATLERILGGSVESVFAEVQFLSQRDEIMAQLEQLAMAAETGNLPDYSALFATVESEQIEPPAPAKPLVAGTSAPSGNAPPSPVQPVRQARSIFKPPSEPVVSRRPPPVERQSTLTNQAVVKSAPLAPKPTQQPLGRAAPQSSPVVASGSYDRRAVPRATRSAPRPVTSDSSE